MPPPPAALPPGELSVVIITHDRREELLRALDVLAALPEGPPVVVVSNACQDGTDAAVRQAHPEVTLLSLPANLGAVGRNLGMRVAGTPFVAFCDDDTWWEPGALALAWETLRAHPRLAVVTGHILVEPDGDDDPICAELEASPIPLPDGIPGHGLVSFLAGASVVRTAAFFGAGGFDRHLELGGEEELLGADLVDRGWAMTHLPAVLVHHRASQRRDPHHRRARGIRNTLWFTWLRRPLRAAAGRTAGLVARLPADRVSACGVAQAARGALWVAASRRPLGPRAEGALRLVERDQLGSRARRYVS